MTQITPSELIAREPPQARFNTFDAVIRTPIAEAIKAPDLLLRAREMLRAGDTVQLYRFADANDRRLVEAATIVITESHGGGVTFAVLGKAFQAPPPAARVVERTEEKLKIKESPHDYRLIEDTEEQNGITFYKVSDGPNRVLEVFKDRLAAVDYLRHALAAWPDYVVTDGAGNEISARFATRTDAATWLARELDQRKNSVKEQTA